MSMGLIKTAVSVTNQKPTTLSEELLDSGNARKCRVEGCTKSPIYKNSDLCNAHYIRLHRHGDFNLRVELHGSCSRPEYMAYRRIKQRCMNPNNPAYKDYGGRGIKVCDRWLESYKNFYEDMGDRPDGMSIERIDNNRGYSPDNCKWATSSEQNNNRRNVHIYKGRTISDWSEITGIKKSTIRARLRDYGWGWERAIKC